MKWMMRILGLASLATTLQVPRAAAWGAPGHEIIASIAETRLSPDARRLVRELIGSEHLSDPDVATWADAQRDPRTRPWHYVNIPLNAAHYDGARDCTRGCAVEALRTALDTLAAPGPQADRVVALRWVVHLVADLHQPLHAGDGFDRGGNLTPVRLGQRSQPTNLHAVWDTAVVRPLLARGGVATAATRLDATIDAASAARWAADLDPAHWADESHLTARSIYEDLHARPADERLLSLPPSYVQQQGPRVEGALARAAVRLAAVLNVAAHRHP